jgi:CheY-like chemotaxis protein
MATPMNILLVEDNDVDVDILRRGLKKLDAQSNVVRAKDGLEALEILQRQKEQPPLPHPFLILLDINMPRMNGHEFLESLREDPDISDSRVIVFTTSDNPKDVSRAYSRNAVGYVVKPDSFQELQKTLTAICAFWERCAHPPAARCTDLLWR